MSLTVMALCAVCLMALVFVAWVDHRSFEISFEALGVAVISGLAAIALTQGREGIIASLVACVMMVIAYAVVAWFRPGRIGRGDLWLFGGLGLLAGTVWLATFVALFCLFALLSAALWSRGRGKPFLKSMFPAAPPAIGAVAPVFAVRILDIPYLHTFERILTP